MSLLSDVSMAWDRARWRLRGVHVFALVGKSGTGKSFRAALIADKYAIQAVIDDGLLIGDGKILAGHSAKREEHFLAAAKTACFTDPRHRQAVREALAQSRFHRVLLIGTSERMVRRNAETLGLPAPRKLIRIEDIASQDEIVAAMHDRSIHGRHVIPLPVIEVRRSYPKMIAESLTVWLYRGWHLLRARRPVEKTVVRPAFSEKGGVTISEAALGQMVLHCMAEQAPDLTVSKVQVKQGHAGCSIRVVLAAPFDRELSSSLHHLHDFIVTEIEGHTGIWIDKLSLSIEEFRTGAPKPERAPRNS